MRYFKNVTATWKESARRKGGYFNYEDVIIEKGFAVDNGKTVDIFDSNMNFISTKRKSGKYFVIEKGTEITKTTFGNWEKKKEVEKTLKKIKLHKKNSSKATKKLLVNDVKNAFTEQAKRELNVKAQKNKAEIKKQLSVLSSLKKQGKKEEWHKEANRMVSIVGYEFATRLGWREVFSELKKIDN